MREKVQLSADLVASPTICVTVDRMLRPDAHPARTRAVGRILLILVLALFASGCTGLLYNRLDTLAGWYLGSLVSLQPAQKQDLRAWLTRMHEWHRASELRRYAEFLRGLAAKAQTPGNRAAYEAFETQIESFGAAVVEQATPEAARLLATLSEKQLVELDHKLEERALERAEESQRQLAKGAWRKERARDLKRQLKRWTGTATPEQETYIAQAVEQLEPTATEWVESQRQWRRLLIETLRRPAAPARERDVLQLLREPNRCWTEAYSAKNERNRERTLALLEQLDGSLTADQRAHLRRELVELADQLDALRET